jgi:hypothetical protein
MFRSVWTAAILCLIPVLSLRAADDPAKKSALDLLPPSTVAYVEIPSPGKLLDTILDHPLSKQLQQQPDYARALESPDMQKLQEVVKVVEEKLGAKWRPAITSLTADGIYVGGELGTQGVIVLIKARDEKLVAKAKETFLELTAQEAKDRGAEPPFKAVEYHGITAYEAKEGYYATLGPWIVFTNKARLGQMVVDNALEVGRPSLAGERQFQQALKLKQGSPTAWGYVDLTILRVTGLAQTLLNKKSDNPVAEMIIGGIQSALPDAPYVTAALTIEPERIAFSTAVPYDSKKVAALREYYFGPGGKGASPALLNPKETLLSLSTYRDFGLMWKKAPDLFDDNINAKFAEAESTLTTLFSGRSFPDDILANLEPGMQIVVTRQNYAKDEVVPAIKLPAGAIVFRMKNPDETARQFKITYQSLVGFLNIAGGQNGLEALEQDTERVGKITLVSAEYLPPKENLKSAGVHFNASPTVAFVGDKFILASTKKLAMELAQSFEKGGAPPEEGINTQVRIDGTVLRSVLTDNRPQLVAQNQQEKGHSQADAEKEIDLLMQLLAGLKETSLVLSTKDDALRVSWELKLAK